MNNKRFLEVIKESMSGLLPVHTIENIAPKVCERLEAEGAIMLPCKEGDAVYVIKCCRCGNPYNFDIKQCHKKVVAKTPLFLERVMEQEMGRKSKTNGWKIEYEVVPIGTICYSMYEKPFTLKMLTEIGKTVFLTKEEAEQALRKEDEGK